LTSFIVDNILGSMPEIGKSMLTKDFIVSSTDLTHEEYADSPLLFLSEIGIDEKEWRRVGSVKVARSVIMSPYLTPDYVDENYVDLYINYLNQQLKSNAKNLEKLAGYDQQ
jgi:hypothetical protein